ncbi:MAG: hypothetical protein IT381_22865 [Deltaproteobacteria bacterium]|nr:hypothetical protein [Deltaproteobacteria bacterium]
MSDEKVNRVGNNPLQAPQPQTKTITKTTKTVSKDEVDALIAKAKAENKQVIEKEGKILIQAQAKHLKQSAPKQNAETGKTETATSMRQASQTAELKGASRVESKQDNALRQTSKVTTAKLGDKPELPSALISKMDAAVVKSLLAKMGTSQATFRMTEDSGAIANHVGQTMSNLAGSSAGNMLMMSGSRESQNFMLLLLLLELGYQNRDINRQMAKTGALLQGADQEMKKTAGLVEIYTKRATATFQYMNKMNDAKAQEQQAMRDAGKAIYEFGTCDIPQWAADSTYRNELEACGVERNAIADARLRNFGPQPPNLETIAAKREAYLRLCRQDPPASAADLDRARSELQAAGGMQAVCDAEAELSPAELNRNNMTDAASRRAANFTNETRALPDRERLVNQREARADEQYRAVTADIEARRARLAHPGWPPGAAEAYGAARAEQMTARNRELEVARRQSRERGDLEGVPADQRTPAQRARLEELDNEKNRAHGATVDAENRARRIERIAGQEENMGNDLPVAERTNWAEVARSIDDDGASGRITLSDARSERTRLAAIPEAQRTPAQNTRLAQLDRIIPRLETGTAGFATDTMLDASERTIDRYRDVPSGINREAYAAARRRYDEASTTARAAQATVRSTGARIETLTRRDGEIDGELSVTNARLARLPPPPAGERIESERRQLTERRDTLTREKSANREERDQLTIQRRSAMSRYQQATAERSAAEAQLAAVRGVGGRTLSPADSLELGRLGETASARGADLTRSDTVRREAQERFDDFEEIGTIDTKLGRLGTAPTDEASRRARCEDCGLPAQPWNDETKRQLRTRYGLPEGATDDQILAAAGEREATSLRTRRAELLRDVGLPPTASATDIAAARTQAQTALNTANDNYATAWRNYNSAMAGLRTRTYSLDMAARGWDGPPAIPPGSPAGTAVPPSLPGWRPPREALPEGVPGFPATPTSPPSAVFGAVAGWREQALADYRSTMPPTATGPAPEMPPPFPEPRTTRASYAADFGPGRIPTVGTPPRPATEAELRDPSSITNPEERQRVTAFAQGRALARADLIDQEATPFLRWGAQVYENHWQPADATNYAEAQRTSARYDAELRTLGIDQRPPPFPPPPVSPADPARDTARRTAVANYYNARRREEGARLAGLENSYTPPRNTGPAHNAAVAALDQIWGPVGTTPPPAAANPTGLAVDLANAPDAAARATINGTLTTARTALSENTPPARDNLAAPVTMKMTDANGAETTITVPSPTLSDLGLDEARVEGGPDQYWRSEDITEYNAARTASRNADAELTRLGITERPPPMPPPPVEPPDAARDTERRNAATAYYTAERRSALASVNGISNSHSPARDPAAARAAVDRLWGTATAPGGLYARYANATAANRPAITTEINTAREPITQMTPRTAPAPAGGGRDDLRNADFTYRNARPQPEDVLWSNLSNLLQKAQAIPNATEYLLQQWTRIAQEQINAMSGMGEELRQRLLRMKSQTSGDWQRTLMAMEKALKATLR